MFVIYTGNLLENASFESSSAGWRANNLAAAVKLQQYGAAKYGAAYAHDGSGFLEISSGQVDGSVAQDVAIAVQPAQSFSFSVWLRAAPGAPEISGTLALWGIGGTQESGGTNFTVGQQWTLVSAPLDVQNSGHTTLRAEIYVSTINANLDVDGVVLIDTGLVDASFESSSSGWRANNLASAVTLQQYSGAAKYGAGYAHDGSGFLEMNSSQADGSVAQDVVISLQPGQSYSFSVWLRAAPGAPQISGTVALWALGGTQESGSTNFTVGQQWTLVSAPVDIQNLGHTSLRAEIYIGTTGANLDVDGAALINTGLVDASFESSSSGWRANNLASAVSLQQYGSSKYGAGYAHDGSGFLEMHTTQANGSVAQDVAIRAQGGESYSFSVWLRAAPGAPQISGTVALWGLGGTQESGGTNFTVGQQWTLVTAPLDVQSGAHTSLRAEIYIGTAGANLDADGATLKVRRFLPSVCGFHFPNSLSGNYPVVTLPIVNTIGAQNANKGVCGGFTFAAMDCFMANPRLPVPTTSDKPASGSTLFNYLCSRLLDSLNANGAKDVEWVVLQDYDTGIAPVIVHGVAWLMITNEWPAIKSDIDSGQPSPLSLIAAPHCDATNFSGIAGALSNSHQVLAYGYSVDAQQNVTIWVYDCNDPNDDNSTMTFNTSSPSHTTPISSPEVSANLESGGVTIRALFHSTYSWKNPSTIAG